MAAGEGDDSKVFMCTVDTGHTNVWYGPRWSPDTT